MSKNLSSAAVVIRALRANVFVYYSSTETSVITATTATAGLAPASSSATSSGNINIGT